MTPAAARSTRLFKVLCCCTFILLNGGCVAIDNFSPRSSTFNEETAESKTDSILTNIVRATYAEPLQFTDIISAQGTAGGQASVNAAFPIPFRGGFGVPLAQQFISPNVMLNGSAGSQFNLGNLNTQEFYNGIQTPLTTQQVAGFLIGGFDPQVLLMLSVAEFEITKDGKRNIFVNSAGSAHEFRAFFQAIEDLLSEGFSSEQVSEGTPIGPALSAQEAKSLLDPIIRTTATDIPTLKKDKRGLYQLQKKGSNARFCFDPLRGQNAARLYKTGFYTAPAQPRATSITLGQAAGRPIPQATIQLGDGDFCGASKEENPSSKLSQSLKLRLRSVEGIFQYLGQISRVQLGLVNGSSEFLTILGNKRPYSLFALQAPPTPESGLIVQHRGRSFGVIVDPSGAFDGSSRVLQLLTTLLALQSSAKNFPAQNLVTVVGQ